MLPRKISFTVWSPFFAVACFAVHITVGTIACDDTVESLHAILALETFAMPFAPFR